MILRKFIILFMMLFLLPLLSSCNDDKKIDIKKAVEELRYNYEGKSNRNSWQFTSAELDKKGDIVAFFDIDQDPRIKLLQSLSISDRVVVARVICPSYKSEFWKILGDKPSIRLWINLSLRRAKYAKVSCPPPSVGSAIKYDFNK